MQIKRVHILFIFLLVVSHFAVLHIGFQKGERWSDAAHTTRTEYLAIPGKFEISGNFTQTHILPIQRAFMGTLSSGPTTQRKYTKAEVHCLTQNIFFEARDQTTVGKIGVGFVVLNRSVDKRWPKNLCSVVRDKRHGVQFSWFADGKPDIPADHPAEKMRWLEAKRYAKLLTQPTLSIKDPTNGALFYISEVAARKQLLKKFAELYAYAVTLDDHIFYK